MAACCVCVWLVQVMLRVGNLERSIEYYTKVLGMKVRATGRQAPARHRHAAGSVRPALHNNLLQKLCKRAQVACMCSVLLLLCVKPICGVHGTRPSTCNSL
jgi:hypothetical protein